MEHAPAIVQDLALILVTAGVVTLIFRKLKQPLVLGYIMAGFLVSPNLPWTMSVVDSADIKVWAEIGVMFLMFALGMDFSFKKILKMGMSPVIASLTTMYCMMLVGDSVAHMFGWSQMDGMFLAGMLAISSTTIIYKAFDDLGLKQQKFTSLVMSVLILEDILAILLMVLLGTLAKGGSPDGGMMINSVLSIGFFIVLWFVVGMFIIPSFLRSVRRLMNEEVLLIVALGLCCFMSVFSTIVGFSSAFGAFVMGSILAETVEAHKIEKVVKPVRDLFGAIFFVSVGMLVDANVIAEQWLPIVVLTLAVIFGKCVFGTFGYMLAGQSLKDAMRCGFSMAQIGEFSFIIASLGLSLGVISDFIYPVVVAVSVITTFITPYMMGWATPAYGFIERTMPAKLLSRLNMVAVKDTSKHGTDRRLWRPLLGQMLLNTLIHGTVCVAIIVIMLTIIYPMFSAAAGVNWATFICGLGTVALMSPFIRAFVMKKNHSEEFRTLWRTNLVNRAPLVFTIIVRSVIALLMVAYVLHRTFEFSYPVTLLSSMTLLYGMIISKALKVSSIKIERRFVQNLRSKEYAARDGSKREPVFAARLLDRNIHIARVEIPQDSLWIGKSLSELHLAGRFGVQVSSIVRGHHRVNIPSGGDIVVPGDLLNVIGSDSQLAALAAAVNAEILTDIDDMEQHDMELGRVVLGEGSKLVGVTLADSGLRSEYNCMLVGLDTGEETLARVGVDYVFRKDDILWIVGESRDLNRLRDTM